VFLDSLLLLLSVPSSAEEQYQTKKLKGRKWMSSRENFLLLLVSWMSWSREGVLKGVHEFRVLLQEVVLGGQDAA
jgi:hypothetical protein